jgi:hypothetical protein
VSVHVDIVPATEEHARALAPRMRLADRLEVEATGGYTPLEALLFSLERSEVARAALFDGEVACMWGVAPLRRSAVLGRVGVAWLLTSDLVERHPRAFWRGCRAELPRLLARFDVLTNAMDCRNLVALRWGWRIGFRFARPETFGVEGLPFSRFSIRKEDLCVSP